MRTEHPQMFSGTRTQVPPLPIPGGTVAADAPPQHAELRVPHASPTQDVDSLRAVWRGARPTRRAHASEYYSLGVEATARVLARLCDDLLEMPPILSEIEK